MPDGTTAFTSTYILRKYAMWALTSILIFVYFSPVAALGQTVEDTVQFISDMTNTHGFVRSLSCRNPKGGKATKITEVYSVMPTGNKLGAIELNHGHDEVNTGFTHFDLHDIDTALIH